MCLPLAALTPKNLPDMLPVFPLDGVLLLPRGRLPLNIFEPRYLAMVDDAMSGDRLIGMIQTRPRDKVRFSDLNNMDEIGSRPLYATGCAGRITGFEELEDGRNQIVLSGVSRFRIAAEEAEHRGYRRIRPDWTSFEKDFDPPPGLGIDRDALKAKLRRYFDLHQLSCDWDMIDGASDDMLITCLSMICPFDPGEKQALLEAQCCKDRAAKFVSLLDMASEGACQGGRH